MPWFWIWIKMRSFRQRSVSAENQRTCRELLHPTRISSTRNPIKNAMRAAETFITSAGPEVVWSVLADVEHWRDWTPTVIEVKALNGTGLKVGAKYRVTQPKLRPATYEVTEYVPNRRFTWVQKFAGGAMIADHRVVTGEGATKVELSFASKGLLANIAGNLFSRMIRDYVATEARSLKKRCDNLAEEAAHARSFSSESA
jgi:carbon monoxide dehydrogenase subunit G